MKERKFDFGGWATRNDLLCADGRTIRKNAFKDDDGRTVPLVWQHNHSDPTSVIGHALLENRPEGVYAYCSFNNTDMGQHVKELVRHKDVNSLSIYANKLKQSGGDVLHGVIREVSVVLAGANPGAVIEFPIMEHGEESETEAVIWPGEEFLDIGTTMKLSHADDEEDDDEGDEEEAPKAKKKAKALKKKSAKEKEEDDEDEEEGDEDEEEEEEEDDEDEEEEEEEEEDDDKKVRHSDDSEETVQDVLDSLTDKQRKVVNYLVAQAIEGDDEEEEEDEDDEVEHADDGGETVADVLKTLSDKQRKVVEFLIGQAMAMKESGEEGGEVSHADDGGESEETVQDVLDSLSEKQRKVLNYLVAQAIGGDDGDDEDEDDDEVEHADDGGETVADILKTLSDKQRKVFEFLIGQAVAMKDSGNEEDVKHYDEYEEDYTMKKNVFDNTQMDEEYEDTLTHAQMDMLIKDAKRLGSLKASVLEHSAEYGIDQIDWLFPEDKNYTTTPGFIQRDMGWVTTVMNGVHHTPFTRVKTIFADITEDQARARGYVKTKEKKTEVFKLLKRSTDPQTIYKKQKLDRDDVIDITDFDVVAWLKGEMRTMLDEEIARAILIGDGREEDSDDHISEDHIRSVFRDDPLLYIVRKELVAVQNEPIAKTFIKTVRRAWKDYKGSGNCIAFMTEDWLNELLLLEDRFGHFMYPNKEAVASILGVSKVVTVPVMADTSTVRVDTVSEKSYKPCVIILNLNDYNVGADKGGSVNMFEDFDIDYNAQKYLIETRCSGALVKPFSAIVIEQEVEEEEANP